MLMISRYPPIVLRLDRPSRVVSPLLSIKTFPLIAVKLDNPSTFFRSAFPLIVKSPLICSIADSGARSVSESDDKPSMKEVLLVDKKTAGLFTALQGFNITAVINFMTVVTGVFFTPDGPNQGKSSQAFANHVFIPKQE